LDSDPVSELDMLYDMPSDMLEVENCTCKDRIWSISALNEEIMQQSESN
jgi:hypothetical protein